MNATSPRLFDVSHDDNNLKVKIFNFLIVKVLIFYLRSLVRCVSLRLRKIFMESRFVL